MSNMSMLTLAQEGIQVPAGAPSAPAPAAPVVGPAPAGPAGTPIAQTPSGAAGQPDSTPSGGGGGQLFFILAMIGLFLFFMFSGNRREKKKQEEIMNSLKKGSRITTVGGLIATVVDVRDSEIVVESSGTRLTFSKAAVQTVSNDDASK